MTAVKYTNDCTTISSTVLAEVLRYARARKEVRPPLTVVTLIGSFQPLDSSLAQKEGPKSSKELSLTQRFLGLSRYIVHQPDLDLLSRKFCGRSGNR